MVATLKNMDFDLSTFDAPGVARLVYLTANAVAEERLVIGVLVGSSGRYALAQVEPDSAWTMLERLYGAGVRELTRKPLHRLEKDLESNLGRIEDLRSSSELISLGKPQAIFTDDLLGFAKDFLATTSSVTAAVKRLTPKGQSISQGRLRYGLFSRASEMNVFRATQLFSQKKRRLSTNVSVDVPILGRRIYGTAVSMASSRPSEVQRSTESHMLRLSYFKRQIKGQPTVYILLPNEEFCPANRRRAYTCIHAITALAGHVGVRVRQAETISALASDVFADDDDISLPELAPRSEIFAGQ